MKSGLRHIALMSVGLAIVVEPGVAAAAQPAADTTSFASKLQTVHDAISSGQLSINPVSRAPSATDESHAVNLVKQAGWSNGFNKGFAQ